MNDRARRSTNVFDLSPYALEGRRQNRTSRAVAIAAISAGVFVILVLLPAVIIRSFEGRASELEWFVTIFASAAAGYIIAQYTLALKHHSAPASSLSVDPGGFELSFASGKSTRFIWTDPELSFILGDYSGSKAGSLAVSTPFGLTVHGVETPLPEEAYRIVFLEASERGLIRRTQSEGNLLYKAGVDAVHHYVSGNGVAN